MYRISVLFGGTQVTSSSPHVVSMAATVPAMATPQGMMTEVIHFVQEMIRFNLAFHDREVAAEMDRRDQASRSEIEGEIETLNRMSESLHSETDTAFQRLRGEADAFTTDLAKADAIVRARVDNFMNKGNELDAKVNAGFVKIDDAMAICALPARHRRPRGRLFFRGSTLLRRRPRPHTTQILWRLWTRSRRWRVVDRAQLLEALDKQFRQATRVMTHASGKAWEPRIVTGRHRPVRKAGSQEEERNGSRWDCATAAILRSRS